MMDTIESCDSLNDTPPGLSEFARELRVVYDEAREFCAFDDVSEVVDSSSFFQNLVDLIHSGFSNLAINYELLLTGEIGAIFVVALIPLLLGIFLEITLLVSHNRKESQQEKRQQAKLNVLTVPCWLRRLPKRLKRPVGFIAHLPMLRSVCNLFWSCCFL